MMGVCSLWLVAGDIILGNNDAWVSCVGGDMQRQTVNPVMQRENRVFCQHALLYAPEHFGAAATHESRVVSDGI
jgi:hypothetical protein